MGASTLSVSVSGRIGRPVEVVRRHFTDVEHHATHPVHPDVEFIPLSDAASERRFRKKTHIFGLPVVDEVVLTCDSEGAVTEQFIAGPSVGTRLISRFQPEGLATTSMTLTLEMPLTGLRRWLAPLLRPLVRGRLARALEEDRRDLEDGGYGA